jgi:hypothetical protein
MRNSLRYLLVGFAFVVGSLFAFAGVANAQDGASDPYVLSNTESRTAELPAAASAASAESASAEGAALAFTGNDVVLLSAVGGVAVVAGAAIMVARRRVVRA